MQFALDGENRIIREGLKISLYVMTWIVFMT